MDSLITTIGEIQRQLPTLRANKLNERATRTKVIDRLLAAMGWDFYDDDCNSVAEEFVTVDGKMVDYALKLGEKPVVFVEAKPLDDSLDIKAVTQVLNYATNANVAWCVLTNGIKWQVFKTHRRVAAQEKILFEIDLDTQINGGETVASLATSLRYLSSESLAKGMLDELGNRIFLDGKISAILAKLLANPPQQLLKIVRSQLADSDANATPKQVQASLQRFVSRLAASPPLSDAASLTLPTPSREKQSNESPRKRRKQRPQSRSHARLKSEKHSTFSESHHLKGRPASVVALYRELECFCQSLAEGVTILYTKCYIGFAFDSHYFIGVVLQKRGLKVWLRTNYDDIDSPPSFARDVTDVGRHFTAGNTELLLMTREELKQAEPLIRRSFE